MAGHKNGDVLTAFPMEIGLRLDVLDEEGIWNTAHVVDVDMKSGNDLIEVQYDGWGKEYNEWVPVDSGRVAPLHMFTIVKKCWAKLPKWAWWPAFVVLRAPTSPQAVQSLEMETKIYVEFYDEFKESKRSRCWMQRKNVVSFNDGFDERASKRVGKRFVEYVEGTQRAAASDTPLLFTGKGSLAIEFSSKFPLPIESQRARIGDEQWYQAFKVFSDRYKELYGYTSQSKDVLAKVAHARGDESDDDVDIVEHAANAENGGYEDEDESEEEDDVERPHAKRTARKSSRKRSAPTKRAASAKAPSRSTKRARTSGATTRTQRATGATGGARRESSRLRRSKGA